MENDNIIQANPDIIVSIIEGLLLSLTLTEPYKLEYISDYAAQLKRISEKLERMIEND